MQKLILTVAIVFASYLHAAVVEWDTIMSYKDCGGIEDFYSIVWYDMRPYHGHSYMLQVDMMLTSDNGCFTLTSEDYDDTATGVVNNWLLAKKGDIADAGTTRNQGVYFNHCHLDHESGWSNAPVSGKFGSDFYLMFAVGDNEQHDNNVVNPYCLYGWVHLYVDANGDMDVLGSAIGLDGQSMVVGAIPEPSAGALLLLGLSMLALRRRS